MPKANAGMKKKKKYVIPLSFMCSSSYQYNILPLESSSPHVVRAAVRVLYDEPENREHEVQHQARAVARVECGK